MSAMSGSGGSVRYKSAIRKSRRYEFRAVGQPPYWILFSALVFLLAYAAHKDVLAGVLGSAGVVLFIVLYMLWAQGPASFRIGNAGPPGLTRVSDAEVMSRHGYFVRKLEGTVQYRQGDHTLTLPMGDLDPNREVERGTVTEIQETRTPTPTARIQKTTVNLKLHIDTCWDPPHEDEVLGLERLSQIASRISEALACLDDRH